MGTFWRCGAIGITLLALAGCVATTKPEPVGETACTDGTTEVETRMVLWLSRGSGAPIPMGAWQTFVDRTLTGTLTDGFSLVGMDRYWRDPVSGRGRQEPGVMLTYVHGDRPQDHARLEDAMRAYRDQFGRSPERLSETRRCRPAAAPEAEPRAPVVLTRR